MEMEYGNMVRIDVDVDVDVGVDVDFDSLLRLDSFPDASLDWHCNYWYCYY